MTEEQVYDEFKKLAVEAMARRARFSARTILEVLRWNTGIRMGGEFKINNNFAPKFARRFMSEYNCPGLFATRN